MIPLGMTSMVPGSGFNRPEIVYKDAFSGTERMDVTYLIEIRLGRTKWRVKTLIAGIAARYDLADFMERHPHVTLYGPLTLCSGSEEDRLLREIGRVASRYGPVPFLIGHWEKREGMHGSVIAFSVVPSEALRGLIRDIAGAVSPFVMSQNAWDAVHDHKWYHVTVANRLDPVVAADVYNALGTDTRDNADPVFTGTGTGPAEGEDQPCTGWEQKISPLLIDETGLRITVMKGEDILAEYDLLEKRWIHGEEIHSPSSWQESLALFRKSAGFELTSGRSGSLPGPYLIADLHLGHANIIRYCSRPFPAGSSGEMDRVLIANWNGVVPPGASAYFLGDLCYGPDKRPCGEYLADLNGCITLIRGNHDGDLPGSIPSAELEREGIRFFVTHDPADAPRGFLGWVVHGHHHNNDLARYPFISYEHRTINVSAEVTGYVPVTLAELCSRIRTGAGPETPPVLLRYPCV